MNVALRPAMTLAEFLAWEERQELRYEFDGVRAIAMTGGTHEHSAIQVNLLAALHTRLRGKPCRPHGSHLKILVAGSILYPEAFVVCTPVPPRAKVVTDPVVIFEVLSESNAREDLVVKNAEYRATPSVKRYVILEQDQMAAQVFRRSGEDWVSAQVSGEAGVLSMPEIGIDLPLSELYADIDLAQARSEPDE